MGFVFEENEAEQQKKKPNFFDKNYVLILSSWVRRNVVTSSISRF